MRLCLSLALCILSSLFAISEAKAPAVATEKVFVLHQKHRWLGKVVVYCNAEHVCVATDEAGAVLVANAPDWRVQIYDPQRKLIYEVTRQEFFDSGYTGPFQSSGLFKANLKQVSRGAFAKIPSDCYTFSRATSSTYWILRSNLSGTPCQILQALYECPLAPGVPLALETQNAKKRTGFDNMIVFAEGGGTELTTSKCETDTIEASKFNYVSGYKKVRFSTEVLVNKKIKNELETGLSEFGLGLGKTK